MPDQPDNQTTNRNTLKPADCAAAMNWIEDYGYFGLCAFTFLAATIVPVSSEAAVLGALSLKMKPLAVLLWASIGNSLGVVLNYFIGRRAADYWLKKHHQDRFFRKAHELTEKYGWLALLASWLPVIGDPITIAAGVVHMNRLVFFSMAITLRIARYLFVIWMY